MLSDQEIEEIFGFNPVPGRPSVMWELQHRVADRASTLGSASDALNGVAVDSWIGHGAESFAGTLGDLRRDVHTAADAHGDVASALYGYVSEQESAKSRAQSLAEQALEAHRAQQAALGQVTQCSTAPSNETDAAKADREGNLRTARGQASTAQGDFDAIVRQARALQAYMESVAGQAAQRIRAAAERAPYEKPGFWQQAWDDVKGAAGAVWHFVSSPEFLHDLSTALGIASAICAFIPGLQGVAVALAVASVVVDVLAKLAAGQPINWLDVGLNVALCMVPGGRFGRMFGCVGAFFESRAAASALLRAAHDVEPAVTDDLRALAETGGGRLAGLDSRFKTPSSLVRKIRGIMDATGASGPEAASRIKDALRYTIAYPGAVSTEHATAALSSLRERGYEVTEIKNYWVDGNPYKGVNSVLRSPGGQTFELQFHTPESFDLKTAMHDDYEVIRDPSQPLADRQAAFDRMVELSGQLTTPPGIEQLGALKNILPPA